jgi:L-rhamnonate dehydratase
MKITKVETLHLCLPTIAQIADGTQDVLIVRVHTDEGYTGLGEVVSNSYISRAVIEAPRSAPYRHGLASIVQGMDALDTDGVFDAMAENAFWYGPGGVARHAMSGIDMALWDIRGKAAGKPVRALISPEPTNSLPCYASTLWPERPDLVKATADKHREDGYLAIKYSCDPMGPDPELDEALVAAARDAVGVDFKLMVDAWRKWSVDAALDRVARFEKYNLYWLEEPIDAYDNAGFQELSKAATMPIATGECLSLPEEYERLRTIGNIDIAQPDLGRVGGITGALRIARSARETKTRVVLHAYGTGVMLASTAQCMAALADPLTEFTRASNPLARDLVRHGMEFREGQLHLSDQPGLGVELNEAVVARYRQA